MEIDHDDYKVAYDASEQSITCSGVFRLRGEEYADIAGIFDAAAEQAPATLVLDLVALEFLNSSGINAISKFVLKLRRKGSTELTIKGNGSVAWQQKSLRNLERLMPGSRLELL